MHQPLSVPRVVEDPRSVGRSTLLSEYPSRPPFRKPAGYSDESRLGADALVSHPGHPRPAIEARHPRAFCPPADRPDDPYKGSRSQGSPLFHCGLFLLQ